MAKKAFVLYESKKGVSDYADTDFDWIGGEWIKFLLAVVLVDSLEEAAGILGGQLERSADETVIWFPEKDFEEIWSDGEKTVVVKLTDAKTVEFESKFDIIEYRWQNIVTPFEGAHPISNRGKTKLGFAIREIPLLSLSPNNE